MSDSPRLALSTDLEVEYSAFVLQDAGSLRPAQAIVEFLGGDLLATGVGGAAFASAAPYHTVRVTLEIWDEQPPGDRQKWDVVEEKPLELVSGRVRLRPLTTGPIGDIIEVGGPGQYGLRASCRGREAARERGTREAIFADEEEWRLQLWKRDTEVGIRQT